MGTFSYGSGRFPNALCWSVWGGLVLGLVLAWSSSALGGLILPESNYLGDLVKKPEQADFHALAFPQDASELLIWLRPGIDPVQFAARNHLQLLRGLRSDPNAYVFSAESVQAAKAFIAQKALPEITAAFLNQRTRFVRYSFWPNDPYFPKDSPAGFPGQWHLVNQHGAAIDARLQGAWAMDATGSEVVIGIVDDCLQIDHPDLAPNYASAHSWDFGENDDDPSPVYSDDQHGTSVAGVAAARGGNALGVTGAAPYASLAGLRVDFENQTVEQFVEATLYHSSGDNTSIKVKNHSYGITAPYVPTPAEEAAVQTSAAAGTIHVFAAGNERGWKGQDANKKDLQNSPDVICVAALGSDGKYADYSNFGANVMVAAPSNSYNYGCFGITTTDRTGSDGYNDIDDDDPFPDLDYTSTFGGTSSAAPLVAGIMALGKQVQPNLDVRFAKHLLVRTSCIVDPTDATIKGGGDGVTPGSAWKTNAAGYKFNQNYGFGLIDAEEFVAQASMAIGVTPLQIHESGLLTVNQPIPDEDPNGVVQTYYANPAEPQPLEEVLVYLNITHTYRGDLEAYLTSPSGTTSRLMIRSGSDSEENIDWLFTTNAFWGENPVGNWELRVADVLAADTGTWNTWSITFRMGDLLQPISFTGNVEPWRARNWNSSTVCYIGKTANGSIEVNFGGQLSSSAAYLGYNAGVTGSATVTGEGSKWTISGNLFVGYQGTGQLTVSDGGLVEAQTLFASLTDLSGNGTIRAKGVVLDADVRFDSTHGLQQNVPFGEGGSLALDVDGTGDLGAGYKQTGSLTITDGMAVTSKMGYLGYWPGAEGTATVQGTGSRWSTSSTLYVGYKGNGGLTVADGAQVSDAYGVVGYENSSEGEVTLLGDSSRWTHSTGVSVGYRGRGALQIQNGAQMTASMGYIGHYEGAQGTVSLTGSGSKWTNTGILYIGRAGQGTLTVEDGAQVSNGAAYLGYFPGVSGTVRLQGAGAKWTSSNTVYGGYQGTATISILQGAVAEDPFGLLGYLAGSQGNATVSGADSAWNHSIGLAVGYYGKGTLSVRLGGLVTTKAGYLGYSAGSEGTAILHGRGSLWRNTGTQLFVGRAGTSALVVQQGARLENAGNAYLAFSPGSSGTVTLSREAVWKNDFTIYVGYRSTGSLEIRHGSQVESLYGILAYSPLAKANVFISGAGSAWKIGNSGYLIVGQDGQATMKIRSGAQVSSHSGYLAYGSDARATVVIADPGSRWTNTSALQIGRLGTADLHIRAGAQVTGQSVSLNETSLLSIDVGSGSVVNVDGGAGKFTNRGTVRLLAGAAPSTGLYRPIAAGVWSGAGQYQAIGGTWNPATRAFTVSAAQPGTSGSPVEIDLAEQQRVLFSDPATGWQVGASFLASGTPKPLTITATAISGPVRSTLEDQLLVDEVLLGGWSFTTTGNFALSDPAYLSFRVNESCSRIRVWQYQEATGWNPIELTDLNYIDSYVNFETILDALDNYGYAVSGLPVGVLTTAAKEKSSGEIKPDAQKLAKAISLVPLGATDPIQALSQARLSSSEWLELMPDALDFSLYSPEELERVLAAGGQFQLLQGQGVPEPTSMVLLALATLILAAYKMVRPRRK